MNASVNERNCKLMPCTHWGSAFIANFHWVCRALVFFTYQSLTSFSISTWKRSRKKHGCAIVVFAARMLNDRVVRSRAAPCWCLFWGLRGEHVAFRLFRWFLIAVRFVQPFLPFGRSDFFHWSVSRHRTQYPCVMTVDIACLSQLESRKLFFRKWVCFHLDTFGGFLPGRRCQNHPMERWL